MTIRTDAHMRSSDAFSWYMERDPQLRSTIVTVAFLDEAPDWERLRERVDRASRLMPHFRHRIVEPPLRLATPRWTVDDEFDLAWHLRLERVAAPGTREQVLELARRKAMTAFDPAHPLWEMTLLTDLEGGGAALVAKIHHALTDGIGGMQLALLLFDLQPVSPELGPMPEPPADAGVQGTAEVLADALVTRLEQAGALLAHDAVAAVPALARAVRHPAAAVSRVLDLGRSVYRTVQPVSDTLSPLMTERHLGRRLLALDVPVATLRDAAHACGCRLNDAYLAAVTGGLARYHEHAAASVDELRVTLPISIRKEGDPIGGNRITLQRYELPAGIPEPCARMRVIAERTRAMKEQPSLAVTDAIAAGLNLLPSAYVGSMLRHIDFLASNVRGPDFPVYLAGARLRSCHPFGPTIGASVNLTLLSYCGTAHIGVNTDTAAVADPLALEECLRKGFDEVATLA